MTYVSLRFNLSYSNLAISALRKFTPIPFTDEVKCINGCAATFLWLSLITPSKIDISSLDFSLSIFVNTI